MNTITAVYRIAKITSQSIGGGRATEVLLDGRTANSYRARVLAVSKQKNYLAEMTIEAKCGNRDTCSCICECPPEVPQIWRIA